MDISVMIKRMWFIMYQRMALFFIVKMRILTLFFHALTIIAQRDFPDSHVITWLRILFLVFKQMLTNLRTFMEHTHMIT